ncbi:hypothetical protein [Streptomyces pini]|uniref:Uncharacterized protein n=1 Tax=Streptomyces pini TaxID=1520580 RepID=A0A1I4C215_9ACTN|nr:hypothetical protein [Streptomyces pini]SFK75104.1 hypothetical protein SAMN05192584_108226 [Streptomyces pini]
MSDRDEKTVLLSGPHRVYVESIPAGVTLDVEPFAQTIVQDVVELLLGDEFGERFDELVDAQGSDPHAVQVPADLRFEQLVADLTAHVSTRLPLYGGQVRRLAERLLAVHEARQSSPVVRRVSGGEAA